MKDGASIFYKDRGSGQPWCSEIREYHAVADSHAAGDGLADLAGANENNDVGIACVLRTES